MRAKKLFLIKLLKKKNRFKLGDLIVAKTIFLLAFIFLAFYFTKIEKKLLNFFEPTEKSAVMSTMTITAYYKPIPKQKWYYTGSYWGDLLLNGRGLTFSGKKVQTGFVAADLRFFPLGSKLLIPGWGEVTVEDTGQAIRGNDRLDVFVGEGEEGLTRAIDWGEKEMTVEVLEKK